MTELSLETLIKHALAQDLGQKGDVTSLATISIDQQATAKLVVKAKEGTLSGLETSKLVFTTLDPQVIFIPLFIDGDKVRQGDIIAKISGPARSILATERVALEFIRRLSGIATKTNKFVEEIKDFPTKILDTRKILPGFGRLDKKAVLDGGGTNHRQNLSEMGLIKNNHIDVNGGDIQKCIALFRESYPNIPLEVEVRNQDEFDVALQNNPDRIMLDNMKNTELILAVRKRNQYKNKYIPLEASGNMTIDRVKDVAKTGVDFISVGSLTHSVEAFDISLHISFIN